LNYLSIINRDFKSRSWAKASQRHLARPHYWILLGFLLIVTALSLGIKPESAEATRQEVLPLAQSEGQAENLTPAVSRLELPEESAIPADAGATDEIEAPAVNGTWHEVTVKSGDSLAVIFSRLHIPAQQLHALTSKGGAAQNLKKIYPGQTLRLMTDQDIGLVKLNYQIDELSSLEIVRQGDVFEVSTTHRTPERRVTHAGGIIDSSLFLSAQDAGMSDSLTMELANIFGWDIDFALDIRSGDQFTVLYEELFLDGEKIDNGNILAAEFVNHGRTFQAVRYTDQGGKTDYYSLDGKSMRKAFLRTPVEFSRISSRFNPGRKHPILNRIRAHKGVDYAAARGTPIKATGDGKIVLRGKKGGYGNTVIVQHGSKYNTLYAHMSGFKRGLREGSRVKQGQVIGFVGSTGLATGPHLHYEFRVNGVHRDPLRVKLPGAEPLNKKYRDDFMKKANSLIARLDTVRNVQVASSK